MSPYAYSISLVDVALLKGYLAGAVFVTQAAKAFIEGDQTPADSIKV
jgi:hypothetical protein